MKFQHPEYFIGILLIPLLIFLYYRAGQLEEKIMCPDRRSVTGCPAGEIFFRKKFPPEICSHLCCRFLPGCRIWRTCGHAGSAENITRQGVDVMIVLDVSKSMLAQDVKPSRLDKAKQLLYRLTDRLQNDRVGLILFAGRAYMQMPLTTDHSAAKLYISEAGPDAVPTQGTVFAEALSMANSSFNQK